MSAPVARCYVPRSVLVAVVAALASCTDAATIMLKMKDSTILRPKGAVDAVDGTGSTAMKDGAQGYFNGQNYSNVANLTADGTKDDDGTSGTDEEALSAVWYLAAFGGLVLFFFVVTCSELFFGNPIYTRRAVEMPHAGYLRRHVYGIRNHQHRGGHCAPETPPPPYHLFAPPSYDDTVKGGLQHQQQQQQLPPYHHRDPPGTGHKKQQAQLANVYVVPVHCAGATAGHVAATAAVAAASDAKLLAVVMPQTKFK